MIGRKKKKSSASKGRRLSVQDKAAIAKAADEMTNVMLAERFDTTVNTIARYRKGNQTHGKQRTRGPGKSSTLFAVEGDYIVLKIPKRGLIKHFGGTASI